MKTPSTPTTKYAKQKTKNAKQNTKYAKQNIKYVKQNKKYVISINRVRQKKPKLDIICNM